MFDLESIRHNDNMTHRNKEKKKKSPTENSWIIKNKAARRDEQAFIYDLYKHKSNKFFRHLNYRDEGIFLNNT